MVVLSLDDVALVLFDFSRRGLEDFHIHDVVSTVDAVGLVTTDEHPAVGNRGGQQYIVVNADARRNACVKAGDVVTIALEPDTEKREIEIPRELQKALGVKLTETLNGLSFTHKKEFVVWYSEAKQEDTRARRLAKMKQMLAVGKVIS